jgi:hypothetical protein
MQLHLVVEPDTDPVLERLARAVTTAAEELSRASQVDLQVLGVALGSLHGAGGCPCCGTWTQRDVEVLGYVVRMLRSASLNAPPEPILRLDPLLEHFQTAGMKGN